MIGEQYRYFDIRLRLYSCSWQSYSDDLIYSLWYRESTTRIAYFNISPEILKSNNPYSSLLLESVFFAQ